ncbi:transmembrane protein 245-like [Watersipora subatra]|uniref:transmembrane protein 245-like n=1 Tax=Watersipora subatra TaxID=2589382 RepID=UPI00355B642F
MDTPKRRPELIMPSSTNYLTPTAPKHGKKKDLEHQHDIMMQQAIYSTGANVFVFFAGLGIIALYWVLESFYRPLMWATLCGAFLFPFKRRITKNIKNWLIGLKKSGTPFTLGIFKVPIDLLDISSETLVNSVYKRWRVIGVVTGVFLTLYVTYYKSPMDFQKFTEFVFYLYEMVSNLISYFSFKWVCGLVICYLIAVARLWSPENKEVFSYLSIPIWLLTMFCLIANAGALRLPLALGVVALMAIGYYTDWRGQQEQEETSLYSKDGPSTPDQTLREISFKEGFKKISSIFKSSLQYSQGIDDCSTLDTSNGPGQEERSCDTTVLPGSEMADVTVDEQRSVASSTSADSELLDPMGVEVIPEMKETKAELVSPPRFREARQSLHSSRIDSHVSVERQKNRRRSDKFFIFLFWSIVVVLLWKNMWLLLIPLISFAFRLVKMAVERVWLATAVYRDWLFRSEEMEAMRTWWLQRIDVIVPAPIRGLTQFMLKGDKKVINVLLGSADTIITVLLIFVLLVGFVSISVAVSFQVQKEGIHLVTVTSNLVQNRTNELQWLTGVLKDSGGTNETGGIHSSLDPMIKNLHTLGREWILNLIAEKITHKPSRLLLENEAISVWDSLYESWVTKNTTAFAKPDYDGALFSHIKNGGVELMWESISLDVSGIFGFLRENIGIFQSVMESVWILLKGNVNLAFNLLFSLLQIILGGGTAILNSFLSLIVFFTTLFYLLASSSSGYKPVEWISRLTFTGSGNMFAQAVEDGIGGVFAASLKMAAFYGVYTWLTHTVFGINIVFLPAVLAAILGAIPFVGTYWAALPAILELSLVHQEVFLALLLAVFHILPILVVDTALYSDIKGGGHPYFTGLAIAGGIYCFGLEGAIIGPVLLCCIIVAMNLHSSIVNSDQPPATPTSVCQSTIKDRNRPQLRRTMSTNNCE